MYGAYIYGVRPQSDRLSGQNGAGRAVEFSAKKEPCQPMLATSADLFAADWQGFCPEGLWLYVVMAAHHARELPCKHGSY